MKVNELMDFPTVFGERLSGVICEGVMDFLSEIKEYVSEIIKQLREAEEERDDLQREVERLSAAREATDEEVLRRTKAIPIDFIERFAKECTSWAEAKPIYDLLVDYAEGDRDIKQKATNIKAHHTRRDNARMRQVYNGCTIATTGTINTLTATPSLRVIERRAE
ncbi:MAG: hypothetical protein IKY64_09845 [Bacteroidaceae bacterium]|nr:hypothetical protein [Bacteroidaceae bacterium]